MNLKELCENAGTIAISGHVRPDGDCIGSSLGLANYLKKLYPEKRITVYLIDPNPLFSFLKGFDEIVKEPASDVSDLFIALDLSEKLRLGDNFMLFENAKNTACIDHHINENGFSKNDWVVPDCSSTAELIYDLIDEGLMDTDIAQCLYIGMVHDTGVFQYNCTHRSTMEKAGKLLEYDYDHYRIIERTYFQKSYIQNQILGRALLESILFMDGKCIVSVIDRKTMDFYGATSKDLEGIANQLRYTRGVECAIFMYEIGTQEYKISLRSSEKINVATVAKAFGGGGHERAAGLTMAGSFHDVVNNLSKIIEKQYRENEEK
ncbi:MAG: bifunctional oligoribonuclease/PAP phosphatase NrnA [Lachnospiraceae bacterium]|nr:bifunctional oligoribonuclease/PAP phosphatase NrnA [Lachnospiraceae bacterium]